MQYNHIPIESTAENLKIFKQHSELILWSKRALNNQGIPVLSCSGSEKPLPSFFGPITVPKNIPLNHDERDKKGRRSYIQRDNDAHKMSSLMRLLSLSS